MSRNDSSREIRSSEEIAKYISNKPLMYLREDELARSHAVNYVEDLVSQEFPIGESVFLVAPTGSGRTSTLNFMESQIASLPIRMPALHCRIFTLRFDCSYLNKTGDSFQYLVKRIFNYILADSELKRNLLINQSDYRWGKLEYSIEGKLFPDLVDRKTDKIMEKHFGENNDVLSLMETLTFINKLTEKCQWLLLIDNYDKLDRDVKEDMRTSLERLHGKMHNILSVTAVDSSSRAEFVSFKQKGCSEYRVREPLDLPSIVGISGGEYRNCLLYTSPSPRDGLLSRMPSSA